MWHQYDVNCAFKLEDLHKAAKMVMERASGFGIQTVMFSCEIHRLNDAKR